MLFDNCAPPHTEISLRSQALIVAFMKFFFKAFFFLGSRSVRAFI